MKRDRSVTKDDVARLIRGKPSKSRCGSRQIRHRLRLDELEQLTVARGRGYLLVHPSTRNALKNAWYLDCVAASRPCKYVKHTSGGYRISGIDDGKSLPETPLSNESSDPHGAAHAGAQEDKSGKS